MDESASRRPPPRRPVEPAWVLTAIGWLAGSLPLAGERELEGASPAHRDLTRMAPRELRRVPGIGEGHAIAIARARWEHRPGSGPLYLDDVHGIGPAIHGRVRAWLDHPAAAGAPASGAAPAPLVLAAPAAGGPRSPSLSVPPVSPAVESR